MCVWRGEHGLGGVDWLGRRALRDRDKGLRAYFEGESWGIHGGVTDRGDPERTREFGTLKETGGGGRGECFPRPRSGN